MAHLYDKAPPAYAKDPWAWDYTREKMEGSCGRPYDQWEGRHFAGAAVIYKNVLKKYGASRAEGRMTLPKECVDCGNVAQHYEDDYICVACRELLEGGQVPEGAIVDDVQGEISVDLTRNALQEKLGNVKRMAPVGSLKKGDMIPGAHSGRNYKAMGGTKLAKCIRELEAQSGDAYNRCVAKGADPEADLVEARNARV